MSPKHRLTGFPFYRQMDAMDCGPTCLRMIARHHGKSYSLSYLRERSYLDREGVSLKGISEAAENIGFRTLAVKIAFDGDADNPGLQQAPLPGIVHWNQNHFVVIFKANRKYVWIADPGAGKFKLKRSVFEKHWQSDGDRGIALLLEPTAAFYQDESNAGSKMGFSFLLRYLVPYRGLVRELAIGLGMSSVFALLFPFLTQSIVDVGIQNQNISFIYLILFGQLALFFGQTVVRFLQNWILLHIGTRINVALISDFLLKLMQLPLAFFDTKMTGDLLQRIGDHRRIESFLTQSTLSIVFSVFNLLVFAVVLLFYSTSIFIIFAIAAVLYTAWIVFFLKRRKEIDYQSFQQLSRNQDSLIEIIQGMAEIKLQGSQRKRRQAWTEIQTKLFRVQRNSLAITQYQDGGALFINQVKNMLITVLAAQSVVKGEMTLGMMLAIQYIIGQLDAPLQQFIGFIRDAQDARISLERLGEIHEQPNEEPDDVIKTTDIPPGDIHIENLSFRYTPLADWVLQDLNLVIPRGKVTAIVGASGSGKTTLVKLLLGFYQPQQGSIKIGGTNLAQIHQPTWRQHCGAVMQDGYIFSNTIADNLAESDDRTDYARIDHAIHVANIHPFIETLPLTLNTMIGARGNGVSQGQRQRLLIARAVYRDPGFLFFDEATNALDANNERIILENLQQFFKGRTVIVVAHRLSTVKNADQIVVLDKGKIVEQGTHRELVERKGVYFTLVKNQLELGE
jgi:ATP-binding cassette subfamily B protein